MSRPAPIRAGDIVETKVTLKHALREALKQSNASLISLSSTCSMDSTSSIYSRTEGSNRRRGAYYPTIVCTPPPFGLIPAKNNASGSTISTRKRGFASMRDMPVVLQHFFVPIDQYDRSPAVDQGCTDRPLRVQPPLDSPPVEPVQWAVAIEFPLKMKNAITDRTQPFRNSEHEAHRISAAELQWWKMLCRTKSDEWQRMEDVVKEHHIKVLMDYLRMHPKRDSQFRQHAIELPSPHVSILTNPTTATSWSQHQLDQGDSNPAGQGNLPKARAATTDTNHGPPPPPQADRYASNAQPARRYIPNPKPAASLDRDVSTDRYPR